MGRQAYSCRALTASRQSIDIRAWHRQDLLTPGTRFNQRWSYGELECGRVMAVVNIDAISLSLFFHDRERQMNAAESAQSFSLAWTACPYGGRRPWLRCHCGRRVAKLYRSDSDRFACRVCLALLYESQFEPPRHRRLLTAQKIRQRLDGSGDLRELFPEKPAHMHWQTYHRLKARADAAQASAYAMLTDHLR